MIKLDESAVTKNSRRSRMVKDLIERLRSADGYHSNHSARGMTLPLLVNALEDSKTPYTLVAAPGEGYYLTTGIYRPKFNGPPAAYVGLQLVESTNG